MTVQIKPPPTPDRTLNQWLQRLDELIAELSALRAELSDMKNARAASNITDQLFGLLPEATYLESDYESDVNLERFSDE